MMTTLQDILKEKINLNGPISIADYMGECLYNSEHGYYMSGTPFGEKGDFTTAPEISQLYGEMIGAWVADTWIKMGKPQKWQLLEAGPGRGTLMKDMLRTLKHALHECYETATITLLEISPMLKIQQRNLLSDHHICWANSIDDIDFSLPTITIANELLDAFPVRQYVKQADGTYFEKLVTVTNDKFAFTTNQIPNEMYYNSDIVETSDAMESFLCKLKDKLTNGAALFIDYGDHGTGDSLQALRRHSTVSVLENPGKADITAHVNFDNVRRVLGQNRTSQMEPMAQFLSSIGLPLRAAALLEKATGEQKNDIESAAYRLMHPEQMGKLFKVIAYRTDENLDLAGLYFETAQESHAA